MRRRVAWKRCSPLNSLMASRKETLSIITWTSWPACLSDKAAQTPAIPAPTMITLRGMNKKLVWLIWSHLYHKRQYFDPSGFFKTCSVLYTPLVAHIHRLSSSEADPTSDRLALKSPWYDWLISSRVVINAWPCKVMHAWWWCVVTPAAFYRGCHLWNPGAKAGSDRCVDLGAAIEFDLWQCSKDK